MKSYTVSVPGVCCGPARELFVVERLVIHVSKCETSDETKPPHYIVYIFIFSRSSIFAGIERGWPLYMSERCASCCHVYI